MIDDRFEIIPSSSSFRYELFKNGKCPKEKGKSLNLLYIIEQIAYFQFDSRLNYWQYEGHRVCLRDDAENVNINRCYLWKFFSYTFCFRKQVRTIC